jgi:hypothetical protein
VGLVETYAESIGLGLGSKVFTGRKAGGDRGGQGQTTIVTSWDKGASERGLARGSTADE